MGDQSFALIRSDAVKINAEYTTWNGSGVACNNSSWSFKNTSLS